MYDGQFNEHNQFNGKGNENIIKVFLHSQKENTRVNSKMEKNMGMELTITQKKDQSMWAATFTVFAREKVQYIMQMAELHTKVG